MSKKNVAEEYDTAVGFRDEKAAPSSLSDVFGLEDTIESEEQAWKSVWVGMPSYTTKDKPFRTLSINFSNQEDFDELVNIIGFKTVLKRTKSIWYPEMPNQDKFSMRFIDEE